MNKLLVRNKPLYFTLWLTAVALLLASCGEKPTTIKRQPTPKLELKTDGLMYDMATGKPYSGTIWSYLKASSTPIKEQTYLEGRKDSFERRWYRENPSQLEEQRLWVRGEPMFHWKWWPNGNLREISAQRSGEKDFGRPDIAYGSYVKWFENGQLKFKAIYDEKFQWNGHIIDYDDTGKLMWDAVFDHGTYVSGHRPPEEAPAPPAKSQIK